LRRRRITQREAEVLRLLVEPLTNPQIAARLGISKRTVESHVSALLRKFAVADRAALIRAGAPAVGGYVQPRSGEAAGAGNVYPRPHGRREELAASRRRLAAQRRQAEFARAVRREQDSIKLHNAAANRLDTLAIDWEHHARSAADSATRADHLRSAEIARRRAQAARARAVKARQRLHAEGVD
jgi:DNA-binding CsgD family transcriptional regulator